MELVTISNPPFDVDDFLEQLAGVLTAVLKEACRIASIIMDELSLFMNQVIRPLYATELTKPSIFGVRRPSTITLSQFDALAGPLMWNAHQRWGKRIPIDQLILIARKIDEAKHKPVNSFEGAARKLLARWNQTGRKPIHTFEDALGSPIHCRGARRRLYRAHDKWKATRGSCPE